ncbi:PEP/pyruvate-binding domain-containing protein [Amycolatopsis anabasis]|uniref:PEP/pyruvate-binding domain-containing protein n=1 Tax=Amycolatopsis anabasis TaxID=1840409 RepID=UPI001FE4C4C8|nr:PEP/pyruvate-binding domain-containing protein [Amycolatopsis anabasis]
MTSAGTTNGAPAVLELAAVEADRIELTGGKGANLATMLAAGFRVPNGFCVTTSVYREVIRIDAVLDELGRTPAGDSARLAELAGRARELILRTALPHHVEAAIVRAYHRLTGGQLGAVAVRSSSTAEDLPDASFAGQYDTYLDVRGVDEVLAALRRCWASLWSDRAVVYRAANGVDHRAAEIAVVVQLMVDAASAGVLFTANPVTGNRTETIVEAAPGLGEAVVSGTVKPDHYRIAADGGVLAGDGILSSAQLSELRATGDALAARFGAPQDVEWAIDRDGRLWLTQSRPITTLFPVPNADDPAPRVYWSLNAYQGLGKPFTPMGAHMLRHRQDAIQRAVGRLGVMREIAEVDGWLFWELTDGVRDEAKRKPLGALVDAFTAPAGQAIVRLGKDPRFRASPGGPAEADSPPRKRRIRWPRTELALVLPAVTRRRVLRHADRLVRGFTGPARAAAEERLRFVERVHPAACRIELDLPPEKGAGLHAERLAANLLSGIAGEGELNSVFRGVPHNPTTEMDLLLWRLAWEFRRDPALTGLLRDSAPAELAREHLAGTLPAAVRNGVADFLAEYGCRAAAEIDFGVPRWADDPEPVYAMLANYLRANGAGQDAELRFARAAAAARAKLDELVGRFPRRQWPKAWLVRFLLRRSRALRGLRELGKFCLVRGWALLREQLLLIGAELVAAGRLDRREDIMFLDLAEVRPALQGKDFRAVVAQRRTVYERECRRPRVPAILLSDGTVPESDTPAPLPGVRTLTGLPAAAGRVTGVARIVRDPGDAHLEPGEILVAPSTDPGWTPLFLTAGALVTETGGMGSHGTTVAREYGIPAVIGVVNATGHLRSGQRVTVDGSTGTISVHEEPCGSA